MTLNWTNKRIKKEIKDIEKMKKNGGYVCGYGEMWLSLLKNILKKQED